jgi:Mg-chelatase subunit ChlD
MNKIPLQTKYALRSGLLCLLMTILVACGGKSDSNSRAAPVFKVTGTIETSTLEEGAVVSDSQIPFAGALVTIDGIQAKSLSNDNGVFTVESSVDFDSTALVTAAKDGYEPFNLQMDLNSTSAENTYQLDSNISMLEIEPWGYLDITVTPNQTNAQSSAFSNALNYSISKSLGSSSSSANLPLAFDQAPAVCDCVMNFSGTAFKKGNKKSELYIMLIVDVSGSTNNILNDINTVFASEIAALTALVNAIGENDKTHIAVLEFSSEASIVLDFTTDLSAVNNALANIVPQIAGTRGAATNYEAALKLTKTTFSAINPKKNDIQTVAFLSDGIPTAPFFSGNTQEKEDRIAAINAAEDLADDDIIVNTFPVNVTSTLTTLPSISAITGGSYYQHSGNIVDELPRDSLVGIIGLEIVNETTEESAREIVLYPDGRYEGSICLADGENNTIKITPAVCDSCTKIAYQKVNVSCEKEECSTCAGQITSLSLKYTGLLIDANVTVVQRKNANKSTTIFDDSVQIGEEILFFGAEKDKTMGPNIEIYVNGLLNAEFTTSCGEPKIGPGLINGDFTVITAYSRNGGLICPLE